MGDRLRLESVATLVWNTQRVYGVAGGYEDLNGHEALRFDQALQTATGGATVLAGKSTLCQME